MKTDQTHAEAARAIVAAANHGALGTMASDHPGYPFVSMVPYALDEAGHVLLALSDLAEHAANLAKDDHASLLSLEDAGGKDPNAVGRVTLLGRCGVVPDAERDDVRARFLAAHANAFYVDFDDFKLYRLTVEQVRYVGGFGRMSWVGSGEYEAG